MDWYEDNEMMRQWEEVRKEEEKIKEDLQIEFSSFDEKELKKRKVKERWSVGPRRRWNRKQTTIWKETQKMVSWRSINQEEIDDIWKSSLNKMKKKKKKKKEKNMQSGGQQKSVLRKG